ncbi:MAG TPA: hypothetical protein VEB66_09780 [Opitutaceae bacterium]|nr:hypothetical protein [Opitutaceae bacterium]
MTLLAPSCRAPSAGFVLVLVVLLLGLLVLVAWALATLGRLEAQATGAAERRLQARQNALTALALAVGSLQAHAAADDRITGMAGIAGMSPAARHWTGVWRETGSWVAWLASGSETPPPAVLDDANSVVMVGAGTLGADGPDREHVRVPWETVDHPVPASRAPRGRLAWWVGDEGVKLSAAMAAPGTTAGRHALDELFPTLDPAAPALLRIQSYGQIAFIPGHAVSAGQLQANAHVVGAGHRGIIAGPGGTGGVAGLLNINSDSARYWRGVAATYNRGRPADERLTSPAVFGENLSRAFASAAGPGKQERGPFTSVEAFLSSTALAAALRGSGVTPEEFAAGMRPWLAVRSDTFRVRAYGDALNPAAALVESAAWCEAVVQRDPAAGPGGRRFVVRSFRWLGPDDL